MTVVRFVVFTQKELFESLKNFKMLILFAVMLIFSMSSPIIAKLTPQILASVDMGGMSFEIPEPTALDSYMQFFSNISQMGILTLLLIFGGGISGELSKGTANIMFAKGLTRVEFILSKLFSQILIWSAAYALSVAVFIGYTAALFDLPHYGGAALAFIMLWLLGIFILALMTLCGAAGRSSSGAGYMPLVATAGVIFALLIAGIHPGFARVSPLALGSYNMDVVAGSKTPRDIAKPIVVSGVCTISFAAAATGLFRKREL